MLKRRHNLLLPCAAIAGLWLAACSLAVAQQKTPPLSEKDWREALAVIRRIALDKNETEAHRSQAVTACVKALLWRERHDEALKFCREVLKGPDQTAVIDAALRAGGLVERNRRGHLRAEIEFLASWARGPHKQAASAIGRQLLAAVAALASLAAKTMVPGPVVPQPPPWAAAGPGSPPAALRFTMPKIAPPAWYQFQPGRAHPALHVTHPKMAPPSWYGRVSFPLLKEPRK